MKCLTPKPLSRILFGSEHFWKVLSPVLGGVAGALGTNAYFTSNFYSSIGAGVAIVIAVAPNLIGLKKDVNDHSTRELESTLRVLHAILLGLDGYEDNVVGLRMCVYVVHRKNPETVVRATNYVGESPGKGKNVNLPLRCGIVGMAFRKNAAAYDRINEGQDLVKYVVDTYGFFEEEAKRLRPDRRSYAAVPIVVRGDAIAAIYLDCKEPSFWGNANNKKRLVLKRATLAIAEIVEMT